ncbi:MAG: cytochrome c oxidase subunit II [Rhodobacteraceae bacterium]|nr:cytochrome c oxidase subunit II [Paracoccaceae bacterium]
MTAISSFFSTLAITAIAKAQEGVPMPTPSFPKPMQLNLQVPVTPVAERIHDFHNFLLVIITVITIFVLLLILICVFRFNEKTNPIPSKTSHNTLLEVIWTGVPILILVAIAVPSFRLLYFMDRTTEAEMTLKVTGNQWFWSYEYPDQEISFDALALTDDMIGEGQHRLLETDRHVVIPVDTTIRLLFTANDVLHAWTIPAFGVKLDTVPGRTNETWTRVTKEGRYYGQCSELCGVDHSFMPIVVDVVSKEAFDAWVKKEQEAAALPLERAAIQLASASR